MDTTFYQPISSIMPVPALPDQLGFVKEGLEDLLADIYYKDLQYSRSAGGDVANYSLSIVSKTLLQFEILGTGISLELNSDCDPDNGSVFPFTLHYEWGILRWIHDFDLSTFSWEPGAFFQLALTVLGLSEYALMERALAVFIPGGINGFVDAYNSAYDPDISYPQSNSTNPIEDVLQQVSQNQDASAVIFAMYILDSADLSRTKENMNKFFRSFFGGSIEEYLKKLLVPSIEGSLTIKPSLSFPRNVLMPLNEDGDPEEDESIKSKLTFDPGTFYFSTERGIGCDQAISASLSQSSRIGNTGFEITALKNVKLDLSRKTNLPEATADGRPEDFVGVFIEEVEIELPPFLKQDTGSSATIMGRNLLIGTGGLSGTIGIKAADDNQAAIVRCCLGLGFELGLTAVNVSFRQNAITASEIKGYMKIPGFKDTNGSPAEIMIDISIGTDGEFTVTASEEQGIKLLTIPKVLEIDIDSLAVGRKDKRFFISVSGKIKFLAEAIHQFMPDSIEVQKLLIWDDGQMELEGGSLVLPKAVSLKIGPADLAITAIHMGSHEQDSRQYKFFGFDGGLSVNPGGVDARGDGIKFYFTTDNDPPKELVCFLRIQSIAIDIKIPGDAKPEKAALLLKGYLAMKGGGSPEYIGGVDFSLPKVKLAGSAAMRYNPRVPSFLIDIRLELSNPIVLGATGLGIYGFRALTGVRYVATKNAAHLNPEDEWWRYYKAKIEPDFKEGIYPSKFESEKGFSLSAGISLATVPDAGRAFSSKLFFLLSLPEVFLLQGQGQVLKERIGLDTTQDPPFFALIAITSTSIETAFGAIYNIPEGGEIAKITGLLEMCYFWHDASAWYINLGKDQPVERRVSARLLTLFDAYFYLMLSSGGISAGAGISYEFKKKIPPFTVELGAYMNVQGRISFKHLQIGGSIEMGGYVGIKIFGLGFRISVDAGLAAEAPRPFTVTGHLDICVTVLRKKRCLQLDLTWTFENELNRDEIEIFSGNQLASTPMLPQRSEAAMAVNIMSKETFGLYMTADNSPPQPSALSGYIIPMDSFIGIEFKKGVNPTALTRFENVSGAPEYTALVPPQRAKSAQVRHEFYLDDIKIYSYDPDPNSSEPWKLYDIYEAATPLHLIDLVSADLNKLPYGYWQKMAANEHNKLRILSQTPFSYLCQGSFPPATEDLGVSTADVFCAPEAREKHCRNFSKELHGDKESRPIEARRWYQLTDILYSVAPTSGVIKRCPWQGFEKALCVDQDTPITILMPKPMAFVSLLVNTEAESVTVTWYGRVQAVNPYGNAPYYEWKALETRNVTANKLSDPIIYGDIAHPILRVDIKAGECGCDDKYDCRYDEKTGACLEQFLNALAHYRDLTKPQVNLYPEKINGKTIPLNKHRYFPSFFSTPLYAMQKATKWVRYGMELHNPTHMWASLRDNLKFNCIIELHTADGGPIDWNKIKGFRKLQMDPEHKAEGVNYGFIIEALMGKGSAQLLYGSSCYSLGACKQVAEASLPLNCDPGLTLQAGCLLKFLDRLAVNRHLLSKKLALFPELQTEYTETFLRSPLYQLQDGTKIVQYEAFWQKELNFFFIRIQDFRGYDCMTRLSALNPEIHVPFNEIKGFAKITLDTSSTEAGENYNFLILAILTDGQEVWLKGRSCYPVGMCHKGCHTCLYQVCYLSVEDVDYNNSLPSYDDVADAAQQMVNGISFSIQPIWGPNKYYAIKLVTTDKVFNNDDENNTPLDTYTRTFVLGFRTTGPPGHYHKYLGDGSTVETLPAYKELEDNGREDEFKLATLQHYLDFSTCYPNADGRLTNAKPLFYKSPRLALFYNYPYVYEMFSDWDAYNGAEKVWSSLEVTIKDPAPSDSVPTIPPVSAKWLPAKRAILYPDVAVINNMIQQSNPCVPVVPATPMGVQSVFDIETLEPLKAYTAIFYGVYRRDSDPTHDTNPNVSDDDYKREVHRYVFQTSRYPDFATQVNSWILKDYSGAIVKSAVYEVDADGSMLNEAAALLSDPDNSNDDLKLRFADPFNRLLDGILKLGALPPAATTEFNIVRLGNTTRVLGILVCNPEPFNGPKLPAGELKETLTLSVNGGDTNQFKALHSKDDAQVFITNSDNSINVPAGTLCFTFRYRRFTDRSSDGKAIYDDEAVITAEFTISRNEEYYD